MELAAAQLATHEVAVRSRFLVAASDVYFLRQVIAAALADPSGPLLLGFLISPALSAIKPLGILAGIIVSTIIGAG